MKTSTAVIVLIIVIVLLGGAYYYWANQSSAPSTALGTNGSPNQDNLGGSNTGSPQQPSGTSATLNVAAGSGAVTNYLTASNGMTLYTYSPDSGTPGKSSCNGQCAANWPPYSVTSAADLVASAGLSGSVGTVVRDDGSLQVTYKGMPLYFYIKDHAAGDTTGQGVGGVWYAVNP